MKRSEKKKLFTKFSYFEVKASACCLVQRRGVSVRQNSSGNPTTRGVRDTLKCEPGKKEVWTPDVDLLSESRVYTRMEGCTHKKIGKPRVTNGSDNSGDLSLRDASLGKPSSMNKRSFTPSNVDSRRKGRSGKGMKEGSKEAHKTTKRKVHFVALMDIRSFKSTCTLQRSVWKNNIISSREK